MSIAQHYKNISSRGTKKTVSERLFFRSDRLHQSAVRQVIERTHGCGVAGEDPVGKASA